MVHALGEARRVLGGEGVLIDIRPQTDGSDLQVVSRRETITAGRARATKDELDHQAAASLAQASEEAEKRLLRESRDLFSYAYDWDSPNEMRRSIEGDWSDSLSIDDELWRSLAGAWAGSDADARLRLNLQVVITRWSSGTGLTDSPA
jgi:hypothetical protein